ncbi:MAG: DUF5012 domain-containing protein [Muribaculaceae bacterium]|nr:DUF5012 domain-containing protein [Muribaculaceae bacterium]
MKKLIYSFAIVAASLGMTSCDGTQEEPHIQWYPVVTLEGEDTYYLEVGEDFTLPGFTAVNTLTDQDATADVEVLIYDVIAGNYVDYIDTSAPGMYTVYYNSYGSEVSTIPTSYVTRSIYVYDPSIETDISGFYNVNMEESLYLSTGNNLEYYAEGYGYVTSSTIQISQLLPGFFQVSDLFGGWYDQIRGYGEEYPSYDYKMGGYIALNEDNSITLLSSYVPAWGDGLDGMWDGEYDPETQTISYEVWYAEVIGLYLVMTNADAE